jgi:hypothetical protein
MFNPNLKFIKTLAFATFITALGGCGGQGDLADETAPPTELLVIAEPNTSGNGSDPTDPTAPSNTEQITWDDGDWGAITWN